MNDPRIVCVGANLESQVALSKLLEVDANIVGLVTLPTDASVVGCDYADLHPLCEQYCVTTIDTTDINSAWTLDAIRRLRPDYIYTLGWSQLFRDRLLNIPTRYVVGSHPSPLPMGRGRAPLPWTILQQQETSAVSLFCMAAGADSGALLRQEWFHVPPDIDAGQLYELVSQTLASAYLNLYQQHLSGQSVCRLPQDESLATHRAKRTPADGHIEFNRPAAEIDRLVRAVTRPYPGAYTYLGDRKVTIWSASLKDVPAHTGGIGQVLLKNGTELLVQAADRPIWLTEVDLPNRELPRVGQRFGYAVEDELYKLRQEVAELKQTINLFMPYARGRAA